MLGIASVFSTAWIGDAMARTDCTQNPPAGKYCENAGSQQNCPAGCYCPGGSKSATGTNHDTNTSCKNHISSNESWFYTSAVYYCPETHPDSISGSKSINDCYFTSADGQRIYNNASKITVSTGQYLQAKHTTPADCKEDYVCPGGEFYARADSDQGLSTCPDGKQPNADKSACEGAVQCPKGSYLPKNTQTCAECPDGFVCKGGSFRRNQPTDQGKLYPKDACPGSKSIVNKYRDGCESCLGGNMKANEDHTECVEHDMDIAPGYYLKANATAPSACFGAKKFCPGGTFSKQAEDQGRYDCPFGANATADNKGCQLKLTKKQMENGASGAGKCWLKTNVEDFKSCIYGVRIQETDPVAAETPTIRDFLRPAGSIDTIESLKPMDK